MKSFFLSAGVLSACAASRYLADGACSATHTLSVDGTISSGFSQNGVPLCGAAAAAPRPLGTGALGATYSLWHSPAVAALNEVVQRGGQMLSIEDLIRSRGALNMSDVYDKWGVNDEDALYYQSMPATGPYCLYRARPNETGLLPDCDDIPETAARHAQMLTDAGVDFIALDATNLCTPSNEIEEIQTRPMEVIFEEFAALRAKGTPTPAISAWWRLVSGCTLHTAVLALYNNPLYDQLVARNSDGRKVFFTPASPDPALVALVESNGGRNDIVVITMWANFAKSMYSQGVWTFMSPCVDAATDDYTTSIVSVARGATGCAQRTTTNSAAGSSATVAASYQLSYGSVPFSGAGQYEGLTLKRQFGTLFDAAAQSWAAIIAGVAPSAPAFPDNVVLSTFNEAVAQPQVNPWVSSPYSFSMGFRAAAPSQRPLFVDSFGASLKRDLEPSVESSAVWDIVLSCVRVLRVAAAAEAALAPELHNATLAMASPFAHLSLPARAALLTKSFGVNANGTSCAVGGEICCEFNATTDAFAPVWSLATSATEAPGTVVSLASSDAAEVSCLLAPGSGFSERCNPYGGTTDFCINTDLLSTISAVSGPFVIRAGGCGAVASGSGLDPSVSLPGRVPVYRCVNAAGSTFLSNSQSCGNGATLNATIGCADVDVTGLFPRSLASCAPTDASMFPFHILDYDCPAGFTQTLLGFVR